MLVFISSRIIIHSAEDYVYPLMDIELFSDILEELKNQSRTGKNSGN